jgi:RNA polymerase sigma factor (sigma-70 family)
VRTGVAESKWRVEPTTWPALRLPRLGDERLARLAARGNARAFAAVYERYHQVLYRYCRSILRDDADAQDALQSTFASALSALKRGQRSAPLRPWLFRIAHNEAISVLRRRRRGEESLADASLPLAASAEDQAGERARLTVLLGDLAALPDRARSALVMRELSGLSHEEIAIALQTTPGAAKQAIFEARRGLQECAEGRAMPCTEVCQAISEGDGRLLRARRVRAHLRDCVSCAAFAYAIGARQSDLHALVPVLPAAASAAVLARTMSGVLGGSGGSAGVAGAIGAGGKTIGVAFTSKGFATASVLATAAVSVGGVAAVVRLAPDTSRLFKAPGEQTLPVRSVARSRSTGPAASHARGSSPARASSAGSVRSGTHTGGANRHIRFAAKHGQDRAIGWHRSRSETLGQFGHRSDGRGEAGWHRGESVGHHDGGAVTDVRHANFEPYAGGRGDHGAAQGHAFGRGDHGAAEGHAVGRGHDEASGSAASDRGHHSGNGSGPAPAGNHSGRDK